MAQLTRAEILAAQDMVRTTVAVPEWGGEVTVRVMTVSERLAYEASIGDKDDAETRARRMVKMLTTCCIDDAGGALFTESDVKALLKKSVKAVHRVFRAAAAFNALTDEEAQALGKAFADPSAASPSGSPPPSA